MNSEPIPGTEPAEPLPLAQRLFDNWLLLMIAGIAMTIGWVVLDLPLGPGAEVFMEVPTATAAAAQPAG